MIQSLCILGRQPALGLAELESLYGANSLKPMPGGIVGIALPPHAIQFRRLGGTVKLAKFLSIIDTDQWPELQRHLSQTLLDQASNFPEGKMQFGLSVYGLAATTRQLQTSGLALKKIVRASGRSVRLVPSQDLELNSAQVLYNNLTGPLGCELLIIKNDKQTILAQTLAVQNINAYAARDQKRPMRDARVGMLPPKLAQIIINLAQPPANGQVFDPFCGTGVILQEAILMGFRAVGSDINQRMVDFTIKNVVKWLPTQQPETFGMATVESGDATKMTWGNNLDRGSSVIASETYLGRPFSAPPPANILADVIGDVDLIHRKFLQNLARQTKPGFRLALAVPAWRSSGGFKHLKILDSLADLGYTRASFAHVLNQDLIYYRKDQMVGRELVVLIRK